MGWTADSTYITADETYWSADGYAGNTGVMQIKITTHLSQSQNPERSAFNAFAKFYDDTLDPWTLSAPTTVSYRIDCLTTGYPVRDWTIVSSGSSVTLPISSSDNAILDNTQSREKKLLTVLANSGLSTQCQSTYAWQVVNLPGQY